MKQNVATTGKKELEGKKTDRSNLIYLVFLSFIFLLAYSQIFDKKLDLNGDNFGYLNYASSILQGHGYSSPYSPDYPATNWFPPGYSCILAVLMLFVGNNIVLLKVANGLFFLGGILLFFTLIKKVTQSRPLAFSVCVLLLLNSGLLRLATILMSEIPYFFFSMLALYSLSKLDEDVKIWKSKYFYGMLLSAVAAYYIRSVGVVLAGAIVLYWIFEKKWKIMASFIAGFSILYIPWMIRNSIHGIKGRYFDAMVSVNNWRPEEGQINTVSAFLNKMAVNFYDTVIRGFTDVLFPFTHVDDMSKSTVMILGAIILVVAFWGAWKTGRYRFLYCSYLLGNILVFLLWHSGNGSRYVWPLAPFIAFFFFYGLYMLAVFLFEVQKKTMPKVLPFAFLAFVFFMAPTLKNMRLAAAEDYLPAYKNYFDMAKAVKKQGNKNLVIACRKAEMFYYFSGTYVTCPLSSLDDKAVIRDLVVKNVDYLVFEQLGYSSTIRYIYPAILKNQELFQPVMHLSDPDTYLFYFDKVKAKQMLKIK